MKKYNTDFTFNNMDGIKAYILGLAWADGYINSHKTRFSISSNDEEIYEIGEIFYPKQKIPIEVRESGCKILHINNKNIVKELEDNYGFCTDKSKNGTPVIPKEFQRYFLLGLFDGDGCVYHKNGRNLRVFYCGNINTIETIAKIFKNNLNLEFIIQKTTHSNILIDGRELKDNGICYTMQSKGLKDSIKILEYLYENTEQIPFLKRKFNKYQEFKNLYDQYNKCVLCNKDIVRTGSTDKYCDDCRILIRRLKNRQNDHYKRKNIKYNLTELLTLTDNHNINLNVLSLL